MGRYEDGSGSSGAAVPSAGLPWGGGLLRRAAAHVDGKLPPRPWRGRTDWQVPPGPAGLPWVGPAPHAMRNPLTALPALQRQYGDAFGFRAGQWWLNIMCHPEHVAHVLQSNQRNYNKATKGYDVLRIALGNGLLTAEGESWLRNRRLAQPAFHRRRIHRLMDDMSAAAAAMRERWRARCTGGATLDVHAEMMDVTLRIVCDTVLGTSAHDLAEEVGPDITTMLREADHRINTVPELPLSWPLPSHLRIRRAIAALDRVVEAIIERRRRTVEAGDGAGDDLLGLLMEARDEETGEGMDDRQLRDEVLTMFLAGHETTANLLSWTLLLLSRNPAIARDVADEAAGVLRGAVASRDDLDALPLLDAVLQESLRLYPPAWIVGRAAIEDDVIAGFDIPAGTVVLLPAWVTHRHPELWESPLGFDPERFLSGREPVHRWAFYPFGGGPRICIGEHFARVEAKILLATILQDFAAEMIPGHEVILEPLVTLRPRDGLPMRVRTRR